MYHYVNNLQTRAGDALVDYYVKMKDSGGNYVTLYSDTNLTPIITVSGVADAAKSDDRGMVDFYVDDGIYDIEVYDSSDLTTLVVSISSIPLYGDLFDEILDLIQTDTDEGTVGIGTAPATGKLTIQTATAFEGNAQHIYHYAQQTDPANQTSPLAIHNYTDGVSAIIDTVGEGVSLRLKQANNASARPDKASTYIGGGDFWEILRARTSGLGNTGAGSDILAKLDAQGSLRFYGADGDDWDGTDTTAPIIFGSYTGFFTETGYMGWDYANSQFIIGSIETGVAFLPIQFSCSAFKILGDGDVDFATPTNSLGTVYAYNMGTKPVAISALPSAASSAGMRAFVSDSNAAASGNFGAVVASGGANYVPVYSDGTDWRIG